MKILLELFDDPQSLVISVLIVTALSGWALIESLLWVLS